MEVKNISAEQMNTGSQQHTMIKQTIMVLFILKSSAMCGCCYEVESRQEYCFFAFIFIRAILKHRAKKRISLLRKQLVYSLSDLLIKDLIDVVVSYAYHIKSLIGSKKRKQMN